MSAATQPSAAQSPTAASSTPECVDMLIIGAGLSGIGAAVHLQREHPQRKYLILEARGATGGTWDLFRYPGIRSDSDMYTLGYVFKPWKNAKAIADGPSIRDYIRDTAREHGIDSRIRLQHKVVGAHWDSERAVWAIEALRGAAAEPVRFEAKFLWLCSGYFSYEAGHRPAFAQEEQFRGDIVHPQFWPENYDYRGKRVVVIGSGATAVTLVPEMAAQAAHVTMLQRSPTYCVTRPSVDGFALWAARWLPEMWAYRLARLKNIGLGLLMFNLARKQPEAAKRRLGRLTKAQLPPDYEVERHFQPRYNPWDQRVCLVPDGDLFSCIRRGSVSVVTDEIDHFTETGIRLKSGADLPADLIVTATGLKLAVPLQVALTVDGKPIDGARLMVYRGMMYSDVPNLAATFGYTNASWTLKADLTCNYVCRLLRHMDRHGYAIVTPVRDAGVKEMPFIDFSSSYVQRAIVDLPKQGDRKPWRLNQNYLLDLLALRYGRLDDAVLRFERPPGA